MTEEVERIVKVMPFKGKKEEWHMWSKKFLARATMKRYKKVLLGDMVVPRHDEELDIKESAGLTSFKARVANEEAYNELLLAMEDSVRFGIVEEAIMDDLPDGDAARAWKGLNSRFEPKTEATKVDLKLEFAQCRLNNGSEDQDVFVSKLENMRHRLKAMNSPITNEDLIIHILNNLPVEYENLIEDMEYRVSEITVDELRERLRSKFRRIMKPENSVAGTTANMDTALYAHNKNFKGRCRVCGKHGHKGFNCPDNKKEGKNSNNTVSGNI
jgi:hypothetical protein